MAFTAVLNGGSDDEDDRMADLLRQRYDRARDTMARVESILTPQQREALPPIRLEQGQTRGPAPHEGSGFSGGGRFINDASEGRFGVQ